MKLPIPNPRSSPPCDPRLPAEALSYRRLTKPALTTPAALGRINVTAWLYVDQQGSQKVLVNPNITIAQLRKEFGPAETPDAEVGLHSEGIAAEWFHKRPQLRVLQIFSERVPCRMMCGGLLAHYFPGVPCYYYYDRNSWRREQKGSLVANCAAVLKTAYGL